MNPFRKTFAVAACGLGSVLAVPAVADMVLSYQETGPANMTVASGTVNTPTSSSVIYGDTFVAPTNSLTLNPSYGFYDDFVFTVASGTVDTTATTISLTPDAEIDDLQVRLYSLAGNSPPVISGTPAGTVYEGWTSQINFQPGETVSSSWVNQTALSAGTYVLEVRGNVVGATGGSYSGVLDLTPVPLPAALPLLVSGLGLLGGLVRRR